ncbi:MAG: ROK family transcriptional regulator [Pseudomonadota bacterium]
MRGGETGGLRAYNQRLIVAAIRDRGPLSKAEIARATGLSGQGAAVIVNALLEEGILTKQGKVRGKVGQPFTPIALNPSGAFSLGIKIGRRSLEVVLVDLLGRSRDRRSRSYDAPWPEATLAAAAEDVAALLAPLGPEARGRIVGAGVAMPGDLHGWAGELGLAPGALDGWIGRDVAGTLAAETGLDVALYNDATAACAAEILAGAAMARGSALYLYVGTFIGGGVVLDGQLFRGAQRNAGALGSMPVGAAVGTETQLIHHASAFALEQALEAAGLPRDASGGAEAEAVFARWCAGAAPAMAQAIVAATSVIDFELAVIDGTLAPRWRSALTKAVAAALPRFNRAGLSPVALAEGTIGAPARVLGAALLPLQARFSPDPGLLARVPVLAAE